MKKAVVAALLLIMTWIILTYFIQEYHPEEVVIDKLDFATDFTKPYQLDPQRNTGWSFMVKTLNGTFLELNISASYEVRILIGALHHFDETGAKIWDVVIFNETGKNFTQKVGIAGTKANFLEIRNEGTTPVSISGDIKKIDIIRQPSYPYSGLGTLAGLLGWILLIYGILARPRTRKRRLPTGVRKRAQKF
ncbi:MAG: hypothetical protein QXX79_01855 [Candidatus Bathyarchaeia archaeon]